MNPQEKLEKAVEQKLDGETGKSWQQVVVPAICQVWARKVDGKLELREARWNAILGNQQADTILTGNERICGICNKTFIVEVRKVVTCPNCQ